jgi:mitochondrial fission protein ELM1
VVEIYKKRLNEIETKEALSRKDKNLIKELKKLLDKVGEVRIQEPRLLYKIYDVFTPKYTLE